jgi:hypothetical protein
MDEERERPRRGRALLTVLAVAAAIAAVPAGVALAGSGGSDQASGTEGQTGTFEVQDQAPEGQPAPDRGDGDRRDCPKDHQDGQGDQGESSDTTAL